MIKDTDRVGRLIAIEGTDCSGKETQTKLLLEALQKQGNKVELISFPIYNSPSGKIVGGAYLGKDHISKGLFPEGATNVDPKVAALYFAADRKYNNHIVTELLDSGTDVILDRYVESNMAHQGGKIADKNERLELYQWLDNLEYKLLELPRPDMTFFLHMPTEYAACLRDGRTEESPDQHELDSEHLKNAEEAYLELNELYSFTKISCVNDRQIRNIPDIHAEIMTYL